MWAGGAGLIAATLCWYAGISRLPLSQAYSTAALAYPLIFLSSIVILRERFTWPAFLGNALIVAGVLLAANAEAL